MSDPSSSASTHKGGCTYVPAIARAAPRSPPARGQPPLSHVGDNATIHASELGDRVMIGHGAVLNDAVVENGALVGFNATINSHVTVGSGSIVASGTAVPEGYEIPPESFVRGVPAEVTPLSERTIDPESIFEEHSSGAYTNVAGRHEELFE